MLARVGDTEWSPSYVDYKEAEQWNVKYPETMDTKNMKTGIQ